VSAVAAQQGEERAARLAAAAPAVTIERLSKRFKLSHERYPSLKERMIHLGQVPHEPFWALQDIDLEVAEGTTAGLLGHNGSGKSTLLKCIAGILRPTSGEIVTRGRVAALLELGAGFQAELTGRENVYLNGAILGMTRSEIDRKFDDIVDFSDVTKFIDTPVKRYSSGMTLRLAFSVAAHLEPEILMVDEVLAVGDLRFQKKCIGKMGEVAKAGRTVLYVAHNMPAITRLCQRAILMGNGRVVQDGPVHDVVSTYLNSGLGISAVREWPDLEQAPGGDDRVLVLLVDRRDDL